jgi:hypothetical protein
MGEAMKDDLTVAQTIERMNDLEVTAKKLQEEGVVMRAKLLEVTEGQYDEIIPIVVEMSAFFTSLPGWGSSGCGVGQA